MIISFWGRDRALLAFKSSFGISFDKKALAYVEIRNIFEGFAILKVHQLQFVECSSITLCSKSCEIKGKHAVILF